MHSIALSLDGKLYSWGCNDDKALGRQGKRFPFSYSNTYRRRNDPSSTHLTPPRTYHHNRMWRFHFTSAHKHGKSVFMGHLSRFSWYLYTRKLKVLKKKVFLVIHPQRHINTFQPSFPFLPLCTSHAARTMPLRFRKRERCFRGVLENRDNWEERL